MVERYSKRDTLSGELQDLSLMLLRVSRHATPQILDSPYALRSAS